MSLPEDNLAPVPGPLTMGHDKINRRPFALKIVQKGPPNLQGEWITWREKGTQDWLLLYTLSGKARIGHDQKDFIVSRGDMVLIRPGTRQACGFVKNDYRWNLIWAHFIPRPEWHDWLDWPEEAPGLMHLTISDPELQNKITRKLEEAHHHVIGHFHRREMFGMNALEEVLLWCDLMNPRSKQPHLDFRVRRALDYLCQNFSEPITLNRLVEHCNASRSRLSYLFKTQVGKTPQQFLEMQRLNRARQLLAFTQHTISEIAYNVGYENPFYFSRVFHKQYGKSPSDFRKTSLEKVR